ncbi:hypothetical protein EYC80_006339 [Monilinia laxa]|uniref:Uncharacterized protein n=1 Tax=Monilinia laxa TaxID=61186 RepID=A0A5N6JRN9_MONLA|nr:hypothetical protein EYC80_006339 [Monilinia laxa]
MILVEFSNIFWQGILQQARVEAPTLLESFNSTSREVTRAVVPNEKDIPGRFDLTMIFEFLKRYRGDRTCHSRQRSTTCDSTKEGILEGIENEADLLNVSKGMNIHFKPEFLKKPIFIVSVPGGRSLDASGKALTTKGLICFFKRSAIAAGFAEHKSFYAWRHVRAYLGHNPAQYVFEQSYNNKTIDLDVFAIAVNETPAPASPTANFHPTLHRVEYDITAEEEKKFSKAYIEMSRDWKNAKTPREKYVAKTARYYGRYAIREQLRLEYEKLVSLGDYKVRVLELKEPGRLYQELTKRANSKLKDRKAGTDNMNSHEIDDID